MTLNVKEALEHVKHALSSDRIPSIGGLRILNDAGEYLVAMHPWRWLEGEQATLGLLPNQPYIWLPEDTVSVSAMVANDTVHANISLTTAMELARRRASTINTSFHYWAALVFAPMSLPKSQTVTINTVPDNNDSCLVSTGSVTVTFQYTTSATQVDTETRKWVTGSTAKEVAESFAAQVNNAGYLHVDATTEGDALVRLTGANGGSVDEDYWNYSQPASSSWAPHVTTSTAFAGQDGGAPMPRLDLWPTPTARKDAAFVAYYRRGWQRLRHDDQAVAIPVWIEPLYISIVRAVALGYERDAEGDVTARLAPIRTGMLFNDLRRRDSLIQTDFGPLQNGAAEFDYGLNSQMWNFDQTGGPS